MRRFLVVAAVIIAAISLQACSTLGFGPADEPHVSPRNAVLQAAGTIGPVLDEVSGLLAGGVISDNVADDINEHGPVVQRFLAAYFDGAEACVVVGGHLETDAAAGRECERSTLRSIYQAVDAEVLNWSLAASERGDHETAATIRAARLVISLVPMPATDGGVAFRDEPDVPLAQFQAERAVLKVKFETMLAAAAKRAGK